MREKMIAGNWKMHKTIPEARRLVQQLANKLEKKPPAKTSVLVCPPLTAIGAVAEIAKGTAIKVGAQNIFYQDEGAFTGEVSAKMVKSAGAKYTLVGHSERRHIFNESASDINRKIQAALHHKVKVVYCIGETLEEREQNLTKDIVLNQMEWDLKDMAAGDLKNLIFAYEPVWAIGTGKTATPQQAQEVHQFIREMISTLFGDKVGNKMTILYGGSVKPENAEGLLSQPDIDGALVGGACLKADSFFRIIKASEKVFA